MFGKKLGTALILLVAVMIVAACGGGNNDGQGASPSPTASPTASPSPANGDDGADNDADGAGGEVDAAAAEALYKQNCLSCHGDNLEGRLGGNTNLTQVGGKMSQEEIAAIIRDGRNGMPSFKNSLSDSDVNTLAAWLATKK